MMDPSTQPQTMEPPPPDPLPPTSSSPMTAMTFEDSNKSWDMLQFHRKARDHEKYCDAILHVQGRQFLCHRLILAANSPYFDSIFQSRLASAAATGQKVKNSQYYSSKAASSTSRTVLMESLIISCPEPDVFATFLNFMYTGGVAIDKSNVAELLRLSNNFMVGKLKEYCATYLESHVDAENCVQVKEVGERYAIPALVKVATAYVQNNLGEVINHEIMMELLPKQVESFVMDKGFQIPHEVGVKFMSRWVCHEIGNRERDYKQMLTNIDWGTMDHETIVGYIDQEPLYGSSERCFYYILQSLGDKGIRVEKYEEIYSALQQRFGQETDQGLGYGDNLLQMAFNSAMEGLQVPTETNSTTTPTPTWPGGGGGDGKEKKVNDENDPSNAATKPKKPTLEQRRRRILRRIHRNRLTKRWVVIRLDRPKPRSLASNEIAADSSGDEECDPAQTLSGYQCHMCPFTAKKISRLERHLAVIHAHDVTYRCSECGYSCKWNREYFLHMKGHFEGPPYSCSVGDCDFSAAKIGSFISHRISHLDLKPYHCTECEFKTRSKTNLSVHLKTHNNEKPYRCGICGRNFASKNSLDQHAVGHNTDKTYSCTQCPFSTKYLNHFTNHKKTHHVQTGKKGKELYRCSDTQCKYTTSKKSQLESHMRSHAGVRPHVCSICGRRFLEKSHLVRHERIHFNERPFKCEECDYASTRRDKLKEHKTRHHGINASAKSPYKPRPHKGKANGSQSQSSSGDSSNPPSGGGVVYAKKSNAANNSQQQQQANSASSQTSSQAQSQIQGQGQGVGGGEAMEFIIPHGHGEGVGSAFATMTSASGLDLQQMANAGLVQLRPYQPVVSVATSSSSSHPSSLATVSSSSSPSLGSGSTLMLQSPPSSGLRKVSKSHRLILVQQGKPSDALSVAQTLASFQAGGSTTMTPAELQRTLGIKLEDLQAGGLINIGGPPGAGGTTTARAIKLEDLGQGGSRGPGTTTTMVLDAAQLQQLTQSGSFERGIPITISSLQIPQSSSSTGNLVVQSGPQQQQTVLTTGQGHLQGQLQGQGQTGNQNQSTPNQQNDFSGLNNLFC